MVVQKEIRKIKRKIDYFMIILKNWDNCEVMWMHYYRQELPIRGTHTKNHIESFNRKIKRRLKRTMLFTECFIFFYFN